MHAIYWFNEMDTHESKCDKQLSKCDGIIGTRAIISAWWRYQIETFLALLALCAGKPLVTVEFASQRPVTPSFDGFLSGPEQTV